MISQQTDSQSSTDHLLRSNVMHENSSESTNWSRADLRSVVLAAGLLAIPSTAAAENFVGPDIERHVVQSQASRSEQGGALSRAVKGVYVHGATSLTYAPTIFAVEGAGDDVARWRQLADDLDRWSYFGNGWDDDSGLAPSSRAIHSAMRFRAMLMSHAIDLPEHYIDGDGEVGFRWRNGDKVGVVAFPIDGGVEGYVDDRPANLLSEFEVEDVGFFPLDDFLAILFKD